MAIVGKNVPQFHLIIMKEFNLCSLSTCLHVYSKIKVSVKRKNFGPNETCEFNPLQLFYSP